MALAWLLFCSPGDPSNFPRGLAHFLLLFPVANRPCAPEASPLQKSAESKRERLPPPPPPPRHWRDTWSPPCKFFARIQSSPCQAPLIDCPNGFLERQHDLQRCSRLLSVPSLALDRKFISLAMKCHSFREGRWGLSDL